MYSRDLEVEKQREAENGHHPVCWSEVGLKSVIDDVILNISFKRPEREKK